MKNQQTKQLCSKKYHINIQQLPQYTIILDGMIHPYQAKDEHDNDNHKLLSAKDIYTFIMEQVQQYGNQMIANINHPQQLYDRLVYDHIIPTNNNNNNSKTKTHTKQSQPKISFLLLTDKYDISMIYISTIYEKYRHMNKQYKFGISRGKNLGMAQYIQQITKYPTMIAIIPHTNMNQMIRTKKNNVIIPLETLHISNNISNSNHNDDNDTSIQTVQMIRYPSSSSSTTIMKDIMDWMDMFIIEYHIFFIKSHKQRPKQSSSSSSSSPKQRNDYYGL